MTSPGTRVSSFRLAHSISVAVLLATAPALAQQLAPAPVVYQAGFISVRCEEALAPAQAKAVGDRVGAAYDFVKRSSLWSSDAPLSRPLTVRVLSAASAARMPGLLGEARGPDTFLVALKFLETELSQGTLAHELTHIQDGRQLTIAGRGKVPHYLLEGRALLIGHAYRVALGLADHQYDRAVAGVVGKVTAAEVRSILVDDPFAAEGKMANRFRMESVGLLFVEFLRTRFRGHGFADVQPRLAKMIEEMATGRPFEDGFAHQFGAPLAAAHAELLAFVQATQGRPAQRLQGMVPGLYLGR